MDNDYIDLEEKYNKHIVFYKNLSQKISKMFNIILGNLYEDSEDIKRYKIQVYFVCNQAPKHYFLCEIVQEKVQGFISEEISLLKYDENSVIYYCTIGSYEINLGYLFEGDDKQLSILYSISKNFFLYIEKELHYIFNPKSILFMDTKQIERINLNLEKDIIISRSIVELFYRHFNLDINFLVNLSSTTYEGIATKCKIIKTKRGFKRSKSKSKSGIKILFENTKSFNQNSLRETRKLLEIAKPSLSLYVSGENMILGYVNDNAHHYECEITIYGHLSFTINYGSECIKMENGVYRIPRNRQSLDSEFIKYSISEKLKVIILEAIKQKHGTLLIIGEKTKIQNESVRLCNYNRGIIIKRLNIHQNNDIIQLITNIDGAILLDTDGYCYGIGIILDGDAVVNGTSSRGARYNSALNYIYRCKQKDESYTAVIISEDKTINFIIPENE